MIQVIRFKEWAHTFMVPGQFYSEIPYDDATTDAMVLNQLEEWRNNNPQHKILGITGPLYVTTKDTPSCASGRYAEIVLLYEVVK